MRPPEDCGLCPLSGNRTNIVLPSGDLGAKVVFVGEAPGEKEDLSGKPFVGRAGSILDGILEEIGVDRNRIMITNVVKCRPPGNRNPKPSEMEACRPFLMHELRDRDLIVGLGKSACFALTGYDGKLSDIVNVETTVSVGGGTVAFLPAYHPMACIYNKAARESLRDTVRMAKERL